VTGFSTGLTLTLWKSGVFFLTEGIRENPESNGRMNGAMKLFVPFVFFVDNDVTPATERMRFPAVGPPFLAATASRPSGNPF